MANSRKLSARGVTAILNSEDYSKAKKIDASALKQLKKLAMGDDWRLAAKAVYFASLVDHESAASIVDAVSKTTRRPALRTAVAAAAGNLPPDKAEPILERLMRSKVLGVRKSAVRSARNLAKKSEKLSLKLEQIASSDPSEYVQRVAK